MRDTGRRTTSWPGVDNEVGETRGKKHPHVVGPRRAVDKVRSHQVAAATERPGGRESGYDERERIAYERIARSFKPSKRI
jgi:hypothetical protein